MKDEELEKVVKTSNGFTKKVEEWKDARFPDEKKKEDEK